MDANGDWRWNAAVVVAMLLVIMTTTPERVCVHLCAGLVKNFEDTNEACFNTLPVTYIMI